MIKSHVFTYRPDIISITETKIDDKIDDNEILGRNYTIYRKDRVFRGGGILVAIDNDSCIKVSDCMIGPGETITLVIQLHHKLRINLVSMYRPPNYNEQSLSDLQDIIEENRSNNTVMIGDFNLPDLHWPDSQGMVKPTSTKKNFHDTALEMIRGADLYQMIDESTHRKGNTLDLVFVNKRLLNDITVESSVLPYISDHNMILIDIKTQQFSKPTTKSQKKYIDYNRANYEEIEQQFNSLKTEFENDNSRLTVEEIWGKFKVTCEEAKQSIPGKLSKPKGHPWINRDIVRLIRKSRRIYKDFKRFPSIESNQSVEDINNEIKKQTKTAKAKFLADHVTEEMTRGNTKPLYNFIKMHSGRSNHIASINDVDSNQIPDALAKHFSSVFSPSDLPVPHIERANCSMMDEIKLSRPGIKAILCKLDPRKACGPDGLSAALLKYFTVNVPSFTDCVYMVLEKSLHSSKVPEDWQMATISPIYKGGTRTDPNNYRPISLTCILSKTLEHIICSCMWGHIDNYELLSKQQHGFRKGLNTTTQLLHVTHFASEALDKQEDYHITSFDFSKAFDRVPHHLLIQKLIKYNFHKDCVSWIEDWLSKRTSVVNVNGKTSNRFNVCSGVPQGSVLGPLLFNIYINDMTQQIKHGDCRLYADDTLISTNVAGNIDRLQEDVDRLRNWANTWGMLFNAKKCVHMELGKPEPTHRLFLGGDLIPTASVIKYLGVYIDHTLKWNSHITKITAKASRSLGMIRRALQEAPVKTKLVAYNTIVRPILEYATQVWSPHNVGLTKSIDMVQRKAIRWIYRLKKFDSVTDCMQANNIISLSDRRSLLDTLFLRKTEAGLFDIELNTYIRLNTAHDTRGKTISWTHNTDQWLYSYYNRMKNDVKVLFPSSD